MKGRGTISWIDCGYVSCSFPSHFSFPLLDFIVILAFLMALKLFAFKWTHIILCSFFYREKNVLYILPSSLALNEWRRIIFFPYGCCYFSDSMFSSLKLRPQLTLPFRGDTQGASFFSTSQGRRNLTCCASAGGQCSSALTANVVWAVRLFAWFWSIHPFVFLNKMCFLLKTFLCASISSGNF